MESRRNDDGSGDDCGDDDDDDDGALSLRQLDPVLFALVEK